MPKKSHVVQPSEDKSQAQCAVHGSNSPFAEKLVRCQEELMALQSYVRLDELTGLFNYRHFMHSIEAEFERVRRSGLVLSLIILDVDDFKDFNDRWGHEVGNLALKELARTVQSTVRRADIPCRYGGEEFAILLPDTPLPAAVGLAERLRGNIHSIVLDIDGEKVSISASFGVDCFTASDNIDVTRFIANTDAFLYSAKEAGRNCVRHASSLLETSVSNEERDLLLGD